MTHPHYNIYQDLLTSEGGPHLSLYFKNDRYYKNRVLFLINQASKNLGDHFSTDVHRTLLSPIKKLLDETEKFQEMGSHVGLFRNNKMTRLVNLPSDFEDFCVVSTSFHVKPLLSWLQSEYCVGLLVMHNQKLRLYKITSQQRQLVSEIQMEPINNLKQPSREWVNQAHLTNWFESFFAKDSIFRFQPLYLSGIDRKSSSFLSLIDKVIGRKPIVIEKDRQTEINDLIDQIRDTEAQKRKHQIKLSLVDFYSNSENFKVSFDLSEILRASLSGQVRQLIVACDHSIFGKINRDQQSLTLTHFHKDHEDDDILDDISQILLKQGLYPIFLPRRRIYKNKPIMALIDERSHSAQLNRLSRKEVAS